MKIREGFDLCEMDDSTVAIYSGSEKNAFQGIVNLNKLGTFLWSKLADSCTKEELVEAVTDQYDVDSATAARDIEAFIKTLRAEKIIVD